MPYPHPRSAGDAFCAGCLWSLWKHTSDREMLEFASAAAACNLFAENSTDGMRRAREIAELPKKYERKKLQ